MNKRWRKIVSLVFLFLAILSVVYNIILSKFIIVRPQSDRQDRRFGIIDGAICRKHENLEDQNARPTECLKEEQHGDKILSFLNVVAPEEKFYYFDASSEDGRITSWKIIEGLEWMHSKKVENVSISLSSKRYSVELEKKIAEYSNEMTIYASYNNKKNTLDYPAKYPHIIGVGTIDVPSVKDGDIIFDKRSLLVWLFPPKFYIGNSYLTPYAMLTAQL